MSVQLRNACSAYCRNRRCRSRSYAQARHVAHPEDSVLCHRLADRADAVSVLVEYLVWAASFRSAGDRVSARRQEAAAHSTGAGAVRRPHVATRTTPAAQAVVSRPDATGQRSDRGSSQHRRLGDGTRHFGAGFHETLLKMLSDSSPMVRGNAALSLVRFGDATGRPQIVALLQPAEVSAPGRAGHVSRRAIVRARPSMQRRIGGQVGVLRDLLTARSNCARRSPGASAPLVATREQMQPRRSESRWSIREPSRCGRRCGRSIWWGRSEDLAAIRPTSAICRAFRTMCASRRWRRKRRFGSGRRELKRCQIGDFRLQVDRSSSLQSAILKSAI